MICGSSCHHRMSEAFDGRVHPFVGVHLPSSVVTFIERCFLPPLQPFNPCSRLAVPKARQACPKFQIVQLFPYEGGVPPPPLLFCNHFYLPSHDWLCYYTRPDTILHQLAIDSSSKDDVSHESFRCVGDRGLNDGTAYSRSSSPCVNSVGSRCESETTARLFAAAAATVHPRSLLHRFRNKLTVCWRLLCLLCLLCRLLL